MLEQNNTIVVAKILYNCDTVYLSSPPFEVKRGNLILVDTSNGPEIASISGTIRVKPDGTQLSRIIRQCTEEDLRIKLENECKAQEARQLTVEKIIKHNLEMKLVSIHYFFDDNKILFSFTADERVDFRELVKDLASVFKRRIELRQIGARDEAKIVKGTGICGRDFCCTAIKNELQPVTIKMAKDQNLTLNSSKISGACGRLLCCLAYEHTAYCETKKLLPAEGSVINFEGQSMMLSEINILKMQATLRTKENAQIQVPLDRILPADKLEQLRAVRPVGSCADTADSAQEPNGTSPSTRDAVPGDPRSAQAAGESQVPVG
jgi:cell fate regulator YaaT (PSP1 superfamily)